MQGGRHPPHRPGVPLEHLMPATMRHAVPAGVGFLVALALTPVPWADGQDKEEPAPAPPGFHAALTLATDAELRPLLLAVPDYVEQRSWPEVARLLPALLDARGGRFTLSRATGRA